jgi:alpha-D-ribose 1-methylphosphonate 5-triphosphate synthase subunit PhnH
MSLASNTPSLHDAAAMNAARAATLLPGFPDPGPDAQSVFRAALRAFSTPGRIQAVDARSGVPAGLSPAMTALLLALVDVDTPLWLPQGIDAAVKGFLRFHCACPLVDDPAQAHFVVVPAGFQAPPLSSCNAGDPAYPDRSCTLLIEVASLEKGQPVTLSGPGIEHTQALSVTGLDATFWAQWRDNHRGFPLGVDVLLTQGGQLCGLPRTTRVEE